LYRYSKEAAAQAALKKEIARRKKRDEVGALYKPNPVHPGLDSAWFFIPCT
jgi:hypothetical protein